MEAHARSRRRGGAAIFGIGLALALAAAGGHAPAAPVAGASPPRNTAVVAPSGPGLVAAIEVVADGVTQALPLDRRHLRLGAGTSELRVRLRPAAPGARYRFRIEGVDADWVETGWPAEQRWEALPPGPHRLVVATGGGGDWAVAEERLLLVDSPWWQTPLVLVAGTAVGFTLLGWFVWFERLRRARRLAWEVAQARHQLAERHSEAKTRFLATLGHEIRTPLTGVLGMAELLADGPLDARQREQLEAIRSAGRHLLRLVNDALDLARIEAGRLPLQAAPFALVPLLRDVAALLQPLAAAKGLRFGLQCDPALPPALLGDATRVRQILFNLGHNAIKFCDRGEVTITVDAPDAGGLRLQVRDSGPGLDRDRRARLFRRFEPGDEPGSGGAGLGLAICRELAVAMGGSIDIASAPGDGACFLVELPLPAAALPDGSPQAPAPARPDPRRLLLVEDDALVAEVVAGLLRRDGHVVVHAPHALAALAELDIGTFDAAIVDLDLPGMDGLAFARVVRTRWPLPMLALTARVDPDAAPAARAAGMAGFLRKPADGAVLAAALADLLAAPPRATLAVGG